MTIDELKDLGEVETGEALFDLRNEILALVEASGEMRLLDCRCIGDCECFTPLVRFTIDRHKNALADFNTKLASL